MFNVLVIRLEYLQQKKIAEIFSHNFILVSGANKFWGPYLATWDTPNIASLGKPWINNKPMFILYTTMLATPCCRQTQPTSLLATSLSTPISNTILLFLRKHTFIWASSFPFYAPIPISWVRYFLTLDDFLYQLRLDGN